MDYIKISVLTNSPDDEKAWRMFIDKQPRSSIFHTLAWKNIIEDTFKCRGEYFIVKNKNEIVGIFPLFIIKKPLLGKKIISLPHCAIGGGVFAKNKDIKTLLLANAQKYCIGHRAKYLEIRSEEPQDYLLENGFVERQPFYATELKLPKTKEEAWKKLDKGHKSAIKQSKKRDLTVHIANEFSEVKEFHQILENSNRNFGTPTYGLNFFENLWNKLENKNFLRLFVAEKDKTQVGGVLLLAYKKMIIYKLGACNKDSLYLRPYNALIWEGIKYGIENGFTIFNFGTTSIYNQGLLSFKKGWGATNKKVYFYYYLNKGKIPEIEEYVDSFGIVKKIWRRLPLPITSFVGKKVRTWVC